MSLLQSLCAYFACQSTQQSQSICKLGLRQCTPSPPPALTQRAEFSPARVYRQCSTATACVCVCSCSYTWYISASKIKSIVNAFFNCVTAALRTAVSGHESQWHCEKIFQMPCRLNDKYCRDVLQELRLYWRVTIFVISLSVLNVY